MNLLRWWESGPYARAFSLNSTAIRLECARICPRAPTTSRRFPKSDRLLVPALFTLWIRTRVPESPVWLERQRRLKADRQAGEKAGPRFSLMRIFQKDLIGATVQTTLVIGAFMCIHYSVIFWYPTVLREAGRPVLPYLTAFNIGAIIGTALWGRLSEGRLGRRSAVTITVILGVASLPLYLHANDPVVLGLGALMMGFFGMGVWGMAPAYSNEQFPTEVRGVGRAFATTRLRLSARQCRWCSVRCRTAAAKRSMP